MNGELIINNLDAYATWGISLDQTSLSELMTPPSNKAFIENKSRLEDGKRVVAANPRVEERSLSLQLNLTAPDEVTFIKRYQAFCDEVLAKGVFTLRTKYQTEVQYTLVYVSCSQFSQFLRGIGKFSLKLNEPNPKNRDL